MSLGTCSSDCECKQNSELTCGTNGYCECPTGAQWYWSDIAGYVFFNSLTVLTFYEVNFVIKYLFGKNGNFQD